MRALLQRVTYGSVSIDDVVVGEIGPGVVILLGIRQGDAEKDAEYLAQKCVNLRMFADENGNLNRSLLETNGEALIISQFTLYGDTRKGRRPSFTQAARPAESEPLYNKFVEAVRRHGVRVATGRFGAMMLVKIHNDGPVTLLVESK
ncbi:MAG: D-aminoacyl-tRNA deacylase [candidate division KSB1 bacterium]|nr:D-aminoacyl-tRNA deacylase [candidate division KSB1 bacterium]MDQ7062845.1 D-aminoacyl-tRNA deacylase [candidate division KSB1 bacterium]